MTTPSLKSIVETYRGVKYELYEMQSGEWGARYRHPKHGHVVRIARKRAEHQARATVQLYIDAVAQTASRGRAK